MMLCWWWSNSWIGWIIANGASITSAKSDESSLSPSSSPRIFNSPISVSSSNKQNTVINRCSASAQNSTSVWWPVGGINSHWNRSGRKGIPEVVTSRNINECSHFLSSTVDLAGLVSGNIGVLFLGRNSLVSNVLEGTIHPSSVTSLIAIWSWAINELLLGEIRSWSLFNQDSAFKSSNCRKSPAWSALSLILDGTDFSSRLPVNVSIGGDFSWKDFNVPLRDVEGEVDGLEFNISKISELINTDLIGIGRVGIMFSNSHNVSQENGFSVCLLTLSRVELLVVCLVLLEGVTGRGIVIIEESKGCESSQDHS